MAKVVFVQDVLFDYHGIEWLSAMLKKNHHEVDLFVLDADRGDVIDFLRKGKADIAAFSVSSTDYQWSLGVARRVKKELGLLTFFGGPHPTYFPDLIENPWVDIICIGEGEYAIVELADALDKGRGITKIRNLWVKKDGKIHRNPLRPLADLDELPMPDRGLYFRYKFLRDIPTKRFAPGRGCPYNCTYCYNQNYRKLYENNGRYVRYRSVKSVIDEILYVRENSRLKYVSFVADTFTTNRKWLVRLLEEYKKRVGLPFYCQARVNELDEELIRKLKECGCHYLSFGIESGSERVRNLVLNKNIRNEDITRIGRLAKKHGLKLLTFNMFGLPSETLEEAFETVRINADIRADVISATVLQPQIGTQIYDYIDQRGLFVEGCDRERIAGHYEESPIKLESKREIINLQRLAYIGVRFPRTMPILRMLVKLPHNFLFDLVLKMTLFIRYKESRNFSWLDMLKMGWHLRKFA